MSFVGTVTPNKEGGKFHLNPTYTVKNYNLADVHDHSILSECISSSLARALYGLSPSVLGQKALGTVFPFARVHSKRLVRSSSAYVNTLRCIISHDLIKSLLRDLTYCQNQCAGLERVRGQKISPGTAGGFLSLQNRCWQEWSLSFPVLPADRV